MKNKVVVNDTADVIWKRKSDGHVVFTTEAQLASISQAVDEEKLYGGIGNQTVALLRSNKEIDLAVRNALWDLEYLSMTQGVAIQEDGQAVVKGKEIVAVEGDEIGGLTITLTETPVDDTATIFDLDGSQQEVAVATGSIEIPEGFEAKAGDEVTVIYDKDVTGETVVFDAKKFSEKYSVEYQTLAYNPETMQPAYDIYIQFDEVVPSGAFEMSLENGTPYTPELNFSVMTPTGKSEMGRIIRVPSK